MGDEKKVTLPPPTPVNAGGNSHSRSQPPRLSRPGQAMDLTARAGDSPSVVDYKLEIARSEITRMQRRLGTLLTDIRQIRQVTGELKARSIVLLRLLIYVTTQLRNIRNPRIESLVRMLDAQTMRDAASVAAVGRLLAFLNDPSKMADLADVFPELYGILSELWSKDITGATQVEEISLDDKT